MPNLAGFSALPPAHAAPSPWGPWSTPQRPASMHGYASPPLPAPVSLPPRPGSVRPFPQRVPGLAPRQPAPRPCYPPVFALKDYVADDSNLFDQALSQLHKDLGTRYRVPFIPGSSVNLHRLYLEVISHGGVEQVAAQSLWPDVASAIGCVSPMRNLYDVLQQLYLDALFDFEQLYFHGQSGPALPRPELCKPRACKALLPAQAPRAAAARRSVEGSKLVLAPGMRINGNIECCADGGYHVALNLADGSKVKAFIGPQRVSARTNLPPAASGLPNASSGGLPGGSHNGPFSGPPNGSAGGLPGGSHNGSHGSFIGLPNGSAGGLQGGLPSALAGGMQGGLPNDSAGGLPGGLPSALAGGMQGGLPNGSAGGLSGGLPSELPTIPNNPSDDLDEDVFIGLSSDLPSDPTPVERSLDSSKRRYSLRSPARSPGTPVGRPVEGMMGRSVEGMMGWPVEESVGRPLEGSVGRPVEGMMGRPVSGMMDRLLDTSLPQDVSSGLPSELPSGPANGLPVVNGACGGLSTEDGQLNSLQAQLMSHPSGDSSGLSSAGLHSEAPPSNGNGLGGMGTAPNLGGLQLRPPRVQAAFGAKRRSESMQGGEQQEGAGDAKRRRLHGPPTPQQRQRFEFEAAAEWRSYHGDQQRRANPYVNQNGSAYPYADYADQQGSAYYRDDLERRAYHDRHYHGSSGSGDVRAYNNHSRGSGDLQMHAASNTPTQVAPGGAAGGYVGYASVPRRSAAAEFGAGSAGGAARRLSFDGPVAAAAEAQAQGLGQGQVWGRSSPAAASPASQYTQFPQGMSPSGLSPCSAYSPALQPMQSVTSQHSSHTFSHMAMASPVSENVPFGYGAAAAGDVSPVADMDDTWLADLLSSDDERCEAFIDFLMEDAPVSPVVPTAAAAWGYRG